MNAIEGRLVVVKWDGAAVAGVRVKGITVAGSPIDVTTDDDAGWRSLLSVAGQVDVSITVSGLKLNDTLLNASLSPTDRTKAVIFEYQDTSPIRTVTGDFFLASYTEGLEYQGAGTFDAEFQSSGVITGTA
jgi:predicted secreted protein